MSVEERFWAKVDVRGPDECWLWTAYLSFNGYGQFWFNGTNTTAHRVGYQLVHGPLEPHMEVDHRVSCPKHCVNPAHLRATTTKQNQENQAGSHRDSQSGIRGVSWEPDRGVWRVAAHHDGVSHFGGRFPRLEDAERAAIALRLELFTHNDLDRRTDA